MEKWSKREKQVARKAFDKAYQRECNALIEQTKEKSQKMTSPDELWELHDLLSEERKQIDQKYDYRYSQLVMVFGILLRQGWLYEADIDGLAEDKVRQINSIARVKYD